MKRVIGIVTLLMVLGAAGGTALAGDLHGNRFGYPGGYHSGASASQRFHEHLDQRAMHREMILREAHRRPMTPWQDARLHDQLKKQARHDQMLDQKFHQRHDYHPAPARPLGFGVQGRNLAFWFGF